MTKCLCNACLFAYSDSFLEALYLRKYKAMLVLKTN